MPDGNEPLIAYLKELRGPVQPTSGELDITRVCEFGLPGLLPGDDPRSKLESRAATLVQRLRSCICKHRLNTDPLPPV
jgi:hypothetical protein